MFETLVIVALAIVVYLLLQISGRLAVIARNQIAADEKQAERDWQGRTSS